MSLHFLILQRVKTLRNDDYKYSDLLSKLVDDFLLINLILFLFLQQLPVSLDGHCCIRRLLLGFLSV